MPYPLIPAFRATYAAYKPSCGVWLNRLEGIRGIPGHPVFYHAHPDAKGIMQLKFQLMLINKVNVVGRLLG